MEYGRIVCMFCIEKIWKFVVMGIFELLCGRFWFFFLDVVMDLVLYFGYYGNLVEEFLGKCCLVIEEIE